MFLSVIIPAYNEEKRLPLTLEKVWDYFNNQNITYEVIVVNDGSKDNTAQVVSDFVKNWDGFRLIDNKENKGKGGVVKQGMMEAKGDWRLFMDADGSTNISEIEKLLQFAKLPENGYRKIENGMEKGKQKQCLKADFQFPNKLPISSNQFPIYEVIIGSRYLKSDSIKVKQPFMRRFVSRFGNILVRILLGIKSVDTQCGFKLFSREATEKIFPLQNIMRWGFDMEILAIAIRKGYKIKEVAVDWYDAEGSQVKKSAALKTLKELIIIKWNLVMGKYI